MNSTCIYSNLSLEVLKLKKVDSYYEEYFNFEVNSNSNFSVCVVMQSIKPIFDEDIFLRFIERLIIKENKIVIITDNPNYFSVILDNLSAYITLVEFPISLFINNKLSIKNLHKFQFPFGKKITLIFKTFLYNVINTYNLPKIKNICLDFDNTLWEGVIGNENILDDKFQESNSLFLLFQNKLKELKKHGILLCLVTKNNRVDVESFFLKNKSMPLKLDDFIILKSNWEPKSKNIIDISNELNINTDTFLFFDDSDFELEEVKINIPNLRSYKVSLETLVNEIFFIPEFQEIKSRKKTADKTLDYKKEFKRKRLLGNSLKQISPYNLDTFERLEVRLKIEKKDIDLKRISEMSEKTNQFNFNKRILKEHEIENLITLNNVFFTCSANDKYGDYGIVGYIHVNPFKEIENFVLSCRALCRGIEYKFIEYVMNEIPIEKIVIKFKETERNKPSKTFLENNDRFPQEILLS
ncbi:MAG: HAD-IIIC family phosphatase [Schleiferiaceae bacterium]|nr:HAD-IIIC family phosphatase [Schleiferiaceae bacterium]